MTDPLFPPRPAKVIDFACPKCGRPCRFTEATRALQHSEPTCVLWVQHRGKPEDFMGLALMSAKQQAAGNLILSDAGKQASDESTADKRLRDDMIEQLHEGFKKL